ncbi:MAG: hypothetical protein WDM84_09320 [Bauldia sp.]
MFLEYWADPAGTAAKFRGDWMLTGDLGIADAEGYVTFVSRSDDIITSSGYRIGPSEIEDCLATHSGRGARRRGGQAGRAAHRDRQGIVVLKPGVSPSPQLANDIRLFVRARLSAAEYPREIAFVDEIH